MACVVDLTLPMICIYGNSHRSFPVAKFKTCSLPFLVLEKSRIHHASPHFFMYGTAPWYLWVLLFLGNWVNRFSWAAGSSAFMRHLSPKAWETDHAFKAKRNIGSIPELGRCPEGRNGNTFKYSCLGNRQRSLVGCSPWGHRVRHDRAHTHHAALQVCHR